MITIHKLDYSLPLFGSVYDYKTISETDKQEKILKFDKKEPRLSPTTIH